MNSEKNKELLEELFRRKQNVFINSFMTYYITDDPINAPSLTELLLLGDSELTPTGKRILEY